MTDLQYEILSTIKKYNDRNKTILYGDVLNILRLIEPSVMNMSDATNNLLKSGHILCGGGVLLDMNSPLTFTPSGEKIYKQEYCKRNPKPISKFKLLASFLYKHIIIAIAVPIIVAVISGLILKTI